MKKTQNYKGIVTNDCYVCRSRLFVTEGKMQKHYLLLIQEPMLFYFLYSLFEVVKIRKTGYRMRCVG